MMRSKARTFDRSYLWPGVDRRPGREGLKGGGGSPMRRAVDGWAAALATRAPVLSQTRMLRNSQVAVQRISRCIKCPHVACGIFRPTQRTTLPIHKAAAFSREK